MKVSKLNPKSKHLKKTRLAPKIFFESTRPDPNSLVGLNRVIRPNARLYSNLYTTTSTIQIWVRYYSTRAFKEDFWMDSNQSSRFCEKKFLKYLMKNELQQAFRGLEPSNIRIEHLTVVISNQTSVLTYSIDFIKKLHQDIKV